MVHDMSGHNEEYILTQMSYARGLGYQNKWLRRKGIILYKSTKSHSNSGTKMIL